MLVGVSSSIAIGPFSVNVFGAVVGLAMSFGASLWSSTS